MGQIFGVIATVVICCLIFSLVESQMILPAHLGNQNVESEVGEVGLMMIPIAAIILSQVAWGFMSFVNLACVALVVAYFLHKTGMAQPICHRIIEFQKRFSGRVESLINVNFRGYVIRATNARYITSAIALRAFHWYGHSCERTTALFVLPTSESDQAIAQLTMPLGTPASVTNEAC